VCAQSINEYPVPTSGASPGAITVGPDGALWFTEPGAGRIGRSATDGTITEFPLATGSPSPVGIATGSDGNLWITSFSRVSRMTTAGVVMDFPLTAGYYNAGVIVAGPDGNLWFGEQTNFFDIIVAAAGRMTTAGVLDDFSLDPGSVADMTAGADGNVWFAQPYYAHHGIYGLLFGRITPAGMVTRFPTAQSTAGLFSPTGLSFGSDGNVWVAGGNWASADANRIARYTTAGVVNGDFPLPPAGAFAITPGPDGALWFLDGANRIGRIAVDGGLAYYAVPTPASELSDIVAGPDGALWFTESAANQIGRLVPQAPTPTPLPPLPTATPLPAGPGTANIPTLSPALAGALALALAASGVWVLSRRR
jgi:virginiamycin B lyase